VTLIVMKKKVKKKLQCKTILILKQGPFYSIKKKCSLDFGVKYDLHFFWK